MPLLKKRKSVPPDFANAEKVDTAITRKINEALDKLDSTCRNSGLDRLSQKLKAVPLEDPSPIPRRK